MDIKALGLFLYVISFVWVAPPPTQKTQVTIDPEAFFPGWE